jgi:hypothetical protein
MEGYLLVSIYEKMPPPWRNQFGNDLSKRDEVTGEWKKLHNRELHDLYSSPNIIRIIKSRRMR